MSPPSGELATSDLPPAARAVVEQYVELLRSATDLDDCARRFSAVAGGTLVEEDGQTLRSTVRPYALKKDFGNVKHYAWPLELTRVSASTTTQGYGRSAITGLVYKVFLAKSDPGKGMPAPVQVLVPQGHPTIQSPKIVNIGSF